MDQTMEQQLLSAGVNIQEGVARFAGNDALYQKFLFKFLEDPSFDQLQAAVAAENWADALTAAHTLKGVSGNLGLESLFSSSAQVVSLLREQDPAGALAAYAALKDSYEEIIRILRH